MSLSGFVYKYNNIIFYILRQLNY